MASLKLAFYARVALIMHGLALLLLFMYLGRTIFIPLFFAFLVAILLHPLVIRFEKLHIPKGLAAFISILIFLVIVGGLVYFFSSQVVRFSKDLPHLQQKFSQKLQDVQDWISDKYHVDDAAQISYIKKSADSIMNTAVNSAATTFVGIAEAVILCIFFFIFTFFILYHRRLLMQFLLALFNKTHNEKVYGVVVQVRSVINSYILGLLTEMAVLIVLIFATLLIMGIKYALLLSVLAAVLNIIPYLGIYTALAISMLITLANGSGAQALGVGIVFIVTHFIDANVILPRIVGGRVKMNPFITIIAVLTGHLVWGIPGMFLFIPLTAIIRIVSEEVNELKPWAILLGEEKR
jgi:predicted PurR-regulated permease PerM